MNKSLIFLFFLLFIVFKLSFCQKKTTNLGDKLPTDFTVRFHEGGGMLPISENIYMSNDSAYFEYRYYEAQNKIYFEINKTELENLYQTF